MDKGIVIAFDDIIYSLQKRGGISVYWSELLKRADPKKCVLLDHIGASENTLHSKVSSRFNCRILSVVPIQLERYLPARRLPKDISIFHSSYYRIPSRKTPTVLSVYDFTYERYRRGLAQTIHSIQKNFAIVRADRILCISESTRLDLLERHGKQFESRAFVTHLAASEIYQPIENPRKFHSKQPSTDFLAAQRPYLLFVGARRPNRRVALTNSYKRFDLAVSAMAGLKNYDLVAVGGEPWTPEDQALVDSFGVAKQVFGLGPVPEENLPLWYSGAHALLYLSDYEGFGLPVLEASQCNCPVIAQKSSSIPEVHGDHSFLIDKRSTEAVIDRVKWLESTSQRQKVIDACFLHAKGFTWDKTWRETLKVYENLL